MTDPTAAPAASTPGSGSPAAPTGGQAPSANTGLTVEAIREAIRAETAPLRDELASLKNAQAAARRVGEREQQTQGGQGVDLSKLDKPHREAFEAQQRELDALKDKDKAREDSERKAARTSALDSEIGPLDGDSAKFANAKILKDLIEPRLRENSDGKVVFDDGRRVLSIAAAVLEFGSQDVFRKASTGQGAGASPSAGVGGAGGSKPLTEEDVKSMTPAERAKIRERLRNGETVQMN